MKTEMSYVDLLNKLYEDVESDNIAEKDKKQILDMIARLQAKLWKYSN